MTQISDLENLLGQLPKSYKAESLKPIRQAFAEMDLTDQNVESVLNALGRLRILDVNKLLEERWERFTPSIRARVVDLRRNGSGDRDRFISGCSGLAADLVTLDLPSGLDLLAAAFFHAKSSETARKTMGDVLRRDWLLRDSPLPFEHLTWAHLAPNWRWSFLYGLVNALQSDDHTKRKPAPHARPALISWLSALATSSGVQAEDTTKLDALAPRLEPAKQQEVQEANPAEDHIAATSPLQPASVMGSGQAPLQPPEMTDVSRSNEKLERSESEGPAQPAAVSRKEASPISQQVTDAATITRAIENLQNLWRSYEGRLNRPSPLLQPIAQVRQLETKLKDVEQELENEIASNQHLKRSLSSIREQAENSGAESIQLRQQAVELKEELQTVTKQAAEFQEKAHQLQASVQELQERLAGQEQSQIGHLQATLKEERRVCRIEIARAIQGKVSQVQSLSAKPASTELVDAYRAVISGLLGTLEAQGVQLER